jgi:hypothetical protein
MSVKGNSIEDQKAFARSLFCDSWTKSNLATENVPLEEILGAFGSLTQRLLPDTYIDPQLAQFIEIFKAGGGSNWKNMDTTLVTTITTLTRCRALFITHSGKIGTAMNTLREGDVICILFGCAFPVVLRERINGDGFMLVGEAYVDGMMAGEACAGLSDGSCTREDFRIW